MHLSNVEEQRHEPRFSPAYEEIRWRRSGCSMPGVGEIVDISLSGLSFQAPLANSPSIKIGDEVHICHVGLRGMSTKHVAYEVAWQNSKENNRYVGCTRLLPTSCDLRMPVDPDPLTSGKLKKHLPLSRHEEPELQRVSVGLANVSCMAA